MTCTTADIVSFVQSWVGCIGFQTSLSSKDRSILCIPYHCYTACNTNLV